MKIIAIILIADMILNGVLGIIQHKVEKDIDLSDRYPTITTVLIG